MVDWCGRCDRLIDQQQAFHGQFLNECLIWCSSYLISTRTLLLTLYLYFRFVNSLGHMRWKCKKPHGVRNGNFEICAKFVIETKNDKKWWICNKNVWMKISPIYLCKTTGLVFKFISKSMAGRGNTWELWNDNNRIQLVCASMSENKFKEIKIIFNLFDKLHHLATVKKIVTRNSA